MGLAVLLDELRQLASGSGLFQVHARVVSAKNPRP